MRVVPDSVAGLTFGLLVAVACSGEPSAPPPGNDTGLVTSTSVGAGTSSTGGATTGSATTGSATTGSATTGSVTTGAVSTAGMSSSGTSMGGSGAGGATTTMATSGALDTATGISMSSTTSTTGDLAAGGTGSGGEGAQSTGTGGGTGGMVGVGGTGSVDQSTLPNLTLHLAGDSTVMTYEAGSAQEGWGQELGQFFIDKVSVNNQAIGGASVRTFQTGRWTNIMSALTAGDYVMIQFGTNDSGTVAGRHVDVPDFKVALGEMIDDVESRQATAILVTPSALQEWSGGMEGNTRLGPYADAMRELGPTRSVLVDDLNARSVEFINMIGQTAAQEIYIGGDKAHFTQTGAIQMAEFVAQELQRIGSPLADYLQQ